MYYIIRIKNIEYVIDKPGKKYFPVFKAIQNFSHLKFF